MIRRLALFIVFASLGWSQDVANRKAFIHAVEALQTRTAYGQPIDVLVRLQEDIGVSAESAKAVVATVQTYNSEADGVESALKRSIFTRRLQIAGEFKVTYSAELDIVNWANLDLNLFLLDEMDELYSRMGEDEARKLARFLDERSSFETFFPCRDGEIEALKLRASGGWQQSPLGFWRTSVKEPLSQPGAELRFAEQYKDALLPPKNIVDYLEGTVVSVTPADSQGRKVLLSMQGDGPADAALLIDGADWNLDSEPKAGTVVRFVGVAREFTREPFLVLFSPERIAGLDVTSFHPNPPFTTLGLSR